MSIAKHELACASDVAARSCFGSNWIVLADAGGQVPPLTAFAHVAKAVRDTVMAGWGGPIPALISGHTTDAKPSRDPHLAVVPLADAGLPDGDGRLHGVALVLPRDAEQTPIADELRARLVGDGCSAELRLLFGAGGVWRLEFDALPRRAVLQPARYVGVAKRWSSITPVIYDRFPNRTRGAEAEQMIAEACLNIGLPAPAEILMMAQSPIYGATPTLGDSAVFSAKPWSLPTRRDGSAHPLNHRLKTHVALTFAEPVCGPIILGAGRFAGLGLCLPTPS